MAARLTLPTRSLQAGLLLTGLAVGLLAGLKPPLAVLAALGLAFVVLTIADLSSGLALFAVLSFVDTVLPSAAGFSVAKLLGLLLVLSWLALVTAGEIERRERVFSHPAFLFLLVAFVGWVAMSALWAEEPGPAGGELLRYLPNAMLFLITFSAVRTRDQALLLIGAFVIGALISAAYGLAVPTDPHAGERLSGAAGNANETAAELVAGTVLAAALAAALRNRPLLRTLALAGAPFCVFGIVLTLSRGGLVALAASLVAAVLVAGRWRAAVLAFAVTGAAAVVLYFAAFAPAESTQRVTTFEGGTGRTDIWKVGWRMVEAHPVRGVGAGNFPISSVHYLLEPGTLKRSDFIVDTPKVAHNMYLEVLAELGVPGLTMFLLVLGFGLGCTLRAIRCFRMSGDRQLEIISRALFVALIGLLAGDVFGSRQFSKQLWLLLSLGPALLAIARAQLQNGLAARSAQSG